MNERTKFLSQVNPTRLQPLLPDSTHYPAPASRKRLITRLQPAESDSSQLKAILASQAHEQERARERDP